MITRTEVTAALRHAEPIAAGALFDTRNVLVGKDVLNTLIEAAKCAKYRSTEPFPASDSQYVLDDGSPVIRGTGL